MSDMRHGVLKPHGTIEVFDPESGDLQRDLLTCGHCGVPWVVVKGSGRQRGMCLKCNQVLCHPNCGGKGQCRPTDLLLENIEQGRDLNHVPVRIAVPRDIKG